MAFTDDRSHESTSDSAILARLAAFRESCNPYSPVLPYLRPLPKGGLSERWRIHQVYGLCSRCWNMTTNEEEVLQLLSGRPTSLRSRPEIEASAWAGCSLCWAIVTKVQWHFEGPGQLAWSGVYRRVQCKALTFVPIIHKEGGLDHIRVHAETHSDIASDNLLGARSLGRILIARIDIYTFTG
jgi:hypothetical protein